MPYTQRQGTIAGTFQRHIRAADFARAFRHSARRLWKRPAMTFIAVLTLALGIGANTALFSVISAALLRLPYPNADRLVMVWQTHLPAQNMRNVTSPANFLNWRAENTAFEQMAVLYSDTTVVGGDTPEQVVRQTVSPNLFSMLGVNAAVGRTFPDSEDIVKDQEPLAVLAYGFWQRRFAADPHAVGTKVEIDGVPSTIIGVMPKDFTFLIKERSFAQRQPDLWVPMSFTPDIRKRRGPYLQTMALLHPGVTVDHAQAAMRSLAAVLAGRDPEAQKDWSVTLTPLRDQLTGEIKPALRVLSIAVGLVLLIACANVATLLLAHGNERRQEIALRLALGAKPWEATRQTLTDSLVLAGLGTLFGLLLAVLATGVLINSVPESLSFVSKPHLDLRLISFAAALGLLTAFLAGLIPGVQASRTPANEILKAGPWGRREPKLGRMRAAFVVFEMALAIVVVIASGLLIRSFAKLTAVNPGFSAKGLLTVRVELPRKKYATEAQRAQFFADVMDKVRTIPGVRSASADAFLPFTGLIATMGADVPGRPSPAADQETNVAVAPIESQFFETMGIRLLQGRSFNQADEREATHKTVISQDLAKHLFPNENPIGKMVQIQWGRHPPSEVIGVVQEVRHAGLSAGEFMTAYWPFPEQPLAYMTLVLRTDADPRSITSAVRQAVASVDKTQPIGDVNTMEDLLSASVARDRFNMLLLALFAGIGLLLAVIGLYGVISGAVEQRTKEIGIRMAVGATRSQVMRLIYRQGMTLAAIGLIIGFGGSLLVNRLMASLLFATKSSDPTTFATVSALLLVVSSAACLIPALRAARIQPLKALRYE